MVLDVYWIPSPAEGRAIFLTCRALGIPVNMKMVDTMKGDQKSESFLKVNQKRGAIPIPANSNQTSNSMVAPLFSPQWLIVIA